MTTEQIIGLALALVVMFIGVAGCLLPGLPSTPFVLAAAVIHKIYFGATGPAWWVLVILVGLTAVSAVLDYLASVYGAKRLGATRRGAVGAVVGGLVGLFFGVPGVLLGPFLGAMAFEMTGGRDWKASGRAGVGATLGLLAGAVGKLACCIAMMGLFTINVIYRSVAAP
jgi:hypothetical protein